MTAIACVHRVTFSIVLVQFGDEQLQPVFAPGSGQFLQTDGRVYIGSLANQTVPNSQFYARTGYSGCIANISVRKQIGSALQDSRPRRLEAVQNRSSHMHCISTWSG